MANWQERRHTIIRKVIASLRKIKENDLKLDKEKLIYEICYEHGCARRTAIEYIQTAENHIASNKT
jgi:hypothetical protein